MIVFLLLGLSISSLVGHPAPSTDLSDPLCSTLKTLGRSLEYARFQGSLCVDSEPRTNCTTASLQVLKKCLDGAEVDPKCLELEHTNFTEVDDKACFCGGLVEYSEMLTSVEALLCEDKSSNNLERTGFGWCPQNWFDILAESFLGPRSWKCYYLSREKKNWYDARQYCRSHGADLVSIESEELDVKMNNLIKLHELDNCGMECQVWIGGLKIDGPWKAGSTGGWYWIGPNRPLKWKWALRKGYTNFRSGEPSQGWGESCLATRWFNQWNDHGCNSALYFICEKI